MPVILDRFLDPLEAHVVKARLDAEGIDATVSDDQLAMAWPVAFVVGGTAVRVAEADLARARAVLDAYRRGDFERDLPDE